MADSKFVESPMTPIANPPAGYGGTGGGEFDGEKGYPKRTSTPNGPPEKARDPQTGSKNLNVDTPIQKVEYD